MCTGGQQNAKKWNYHHDESCQQPLPDDRQHPHHGAATSIEMLQPVADPAECLADQTEYIAQYFQRHAKCPANDRMTHPVIVAGFDLGSKGIEEADDDGRAAESAQSANQQAKLGIVPDVEGRFVKGGFKKPYHRCYHQHHQSHAAHQIQIQRDAVDGGKVNFAIATAAGYGEKEYQRDDEDHQRGQNCGNVIIPIGIQHGNQHEVRVHNGCVGQIDHYIVGGTGIEIDGVKQLVPIAVFIYINIVIFLGINCLLTPHPGQRFVIDSHGRRAADDAQIGIGRKIFCGERFVQINLAGHHGIIGRDGVGEVVLLAAQIGGAVDAFDQLTLFVDFHRILTAQMIHIIGIENIIHQAGRRVAEGLGGMILGIVFCQLGAGIVHLISADHIQRRLI